MKATPENKVKKELRLFLDSIKGLHYYSATAGAYSTSGIPDIIGCYKGRFFGIEVKAPGRRNEANRGASQLQVKQMIRFNEAGGFTMIFDGGKDDWDTLQNWMEGL